MSAGEEGAADHPAERKGQQQAEDRPEMKVRSTQEIIGSLIRSGAKRSLLPRWVWMKIQPTWAWTRPRIAPLQTVAVVDVGAVRVAFLVGEGVVLAVVGDPGDDRALDRRRAEDREEAVQPAVGLEAAVGEVAVEADRDPEAGEEVHAEEEEDVGPVQGDAPDLPGGEAEGDEGDQR